MAGFIPTVCPCIADCGKYLIKVISLDFLRNLHYCFSLSRISAA